MMKAMSVPNILVGVIDFKIAANFIIQHLAGFATKKSFFNFAGAPSLSSSYDHAYQVKDGDVDIPQEKNYIVWVVIEQPC